MRNRIQIFSALLVLALLTLAGQADAQCAMCTKAAADGLKDGQTVTAGINTGILYLLATPYVIIGTIGVMWYLNRRRVIREEAELGL